MKENEVSLKQAKKEDSSAWVAELAKSKNATQIFVVAGVEKTTAYVSMHEKDSAIFVHCFGTNKPYTAGCVAIPKEQMIKVMKNVKKDCLVIIESLKNISPETWKNWEL